VSVQHVAQQWIGTGLERDHTKLDPLEACGRTSGVTDVAQSRSRGSFFLKKAFDSVKKLWTCYINASPNGDWYRGGYWILESPYHVERRTMNIYANDKRNLVSTSQTLMEAMMLIFAFALLVSPFIGGVV
jgi:hypothetical protein